MKIPDNAILPRRLWSELVQWRAGYHCEDCERDREQLKARGFSGRLVAHHLDENKENNKLSNGRCLCPSCHQTIHAKGSDPCPDGCECAKHDPKEFPGRAGSPCPEGCTCKRHRRPSKPFTGGSSPCSQTCNCAKHKARFHGKRKFEQPCTRCGKTAFRVSPGLCANCQMTAWRARQKACA